MYNYKKKIIAIALVISLCFASGSFNFVKAEQEAPEEIYSFSQIPGTAYVEITGSTAKEDVKIPEMLGGRQVVSIAQSVFLGNIYITSVEFPEGFTTLKDMAFFACANLESVKFPASLTELGTTVFGECTSLKEIKVDKDNPDFSDIDGVLFNKDASKIVYYPIGRNDFSYKIPDSVTVVGSSAFSGANKLSKVTMPKNLTVIEDGAFYKCLFISSYTLPSTLKEIGKRAFFGSVALNEVIMNEGLQSIGDSAFGYCNKLLSVQVPKSVTAIGSMALGFNDENKKIDAMVIYCYKDSAAHTYAKNSKLQTVIITEEPSTDITTTEPGQSTTQKPSETTTKPDGTTSKQITEPTSPTSPTGTTEPHSEYNPAVPDLRAHSDYKIYIRDRYIKNVKPETLYSDFLLNFNNANISALDVNGNIFLRGNYITTGSKLYIYDLWGKKLSQYSVVVYGDVDADGKVTAVDARTVLRASAYLETLEGVYYQAANVLGKLWLDAASARKILRVSAGLDTVKYTDIVPEKTTGEAES